MMILEISRRLAAGMVVAAALWATAFAILATDAAPRSQHVVTTGTPAP